jgi:hypothetical protein
MKYLLLVLLFITSFTVNSATLYSRASGSWNIGSNWSIVGCGGAPCNFTPGVGDIVYICIGHTITKNSDLTIGSGNPSSVIVNGTLNLSNPPNTFWDILVKNGGTLTVNGSLNVDDAEFSNGSVVNFNAGSTTQINGDLENKNNSNHVFIDGVVSVDGDFENDGTIGGQGILSVDEESEGSGTIFGGPNNQTGPYVFGGTSLPIELLYFSRDLYDDCVVLYWATASESNNDYFIVDKSVTGYDWKVISIVDGSLNSSNIKQYSYKDYDIYTNGIFYYRLTQVDINGDREIFDIISVFINNRKLKKISKVNNILGQDVDLDYNGLKIITYEDGTIEKMN